MTSDEIERRLDKAFSKRIRLVVENPHRQFSSAWMFWGNNSDFYFGAKSISGTFKVSLHENGRGYVAYHKPYFVKKRTEGIAIPAKTVLEWALPKPALSGAVHAASLILPIAVRLRSAMTLVGRRLCSVLRTDAARKSEFFSRTSMRPRWKPS